MGGYGTGSGPRNTFEPGSRARGIETPCMRTPSTTSSSAAVPPFAGWPIARAPMPNASKRVLMLRLHPARCPVPIRKGCAHSPPGPRCLPRSSAAPRTPLFPVIPPTDSRGGTRRSAAGRRGLSRSAYASPRRDEASACYRTHFPLGSHFTEMRAPCSDGSLPSGDKLILITTSHS